MSRHKSAKGDQGETGTERNGDGAILRDKHSVLTVSCRLQGEYAISHVCLSVPCVVSREGIQRIITGPLREEEQKGLEHSASLLQQTLRDLTHSEKGQA